MEIKLKPISEQVAVIFGASSGIGRLTALEFAKRGAKVCVVARGETGLQTLVEEIEANGGEAFYLVADTADFAQVKAVADKTVEKFGRLDTWIHSAVAFIFSSSDTAYALGVPDGTISLAGLAANIPLAAFGGENRAEEIPIVHWLPPRNPLSKRRRLGIFTKCPPKKKNGAVTVLSARWQISALRL